MDFDSLTGKVLERVWMFPAGPVHPAWVDEFTTPMNTWEAFLEFADGEFLSICPCEVQVAQDRYPALGLALRMCTPEAMTMKYSSGEVVATVPLDEVSGFLPAAICSVEASDPLGEDTPTQYAISGVGWRIIFRHISPPMTLGIGVEGNAQR